MIDLFFVLSVFSFLRHLDIPYWSFTSLHAISVWIALDDATLENGCMYFMPGSHKVIKCRKDHFFEEFEFDRLQNVVIMNQTIHLRK
jgi:ectoine hydroxylase-related dioxygenase (phytanoyl-CoA dioxygenase family)